MAELRIDCEPVGDGEWHVFMYGRCDALAASELLGAARGLVMVGARHVSLDTDDSEIFATRAFSWFRSARCRSTKNHTTAPTTATNANLSLVALRSLSIRAARYSRSGTWSPDGSPVTV